MANRFVRVAEVARELRVSGETIRQLIYRGELNAVRVGRQWRVTDASVRELIRLGSGQFANSASKHGHLCKPAQE